MKIIIPMAGLGKRMRPHTLTTPKPLLPVAGRPIVEILIEDIAEMLGGGVEEVGFIIGDFGKEVEENLLHIASKLGYKGKIYYQLEALGTAHALWCAKESLEGNVLVAYADTLFHTDLKVDKQEDGIIWVKKIEDPSLFGVVITDKNGYIERFAEKPKEFVSDLAIIGIYYFRSGEALRNEIQYLLDNKITGNGEYQLTDALDRMMNSGNRFLASEVDGWFDCGNKNATVATNKDILMLNSGKNMVSEDAIIENSEIVQPCFIDTGVKITGSKVGPYVSMGKNTVIRNSTISNSIIMTETEIFDAVLNNSMIGNHVKFTNNSTDVSIGDFSQLI